MTTDVVTSHLRRGFMDKTPRMSTLDEESYLDLMKGLRDLAVGPVSAAFRERATIEIDRATAQGQPPRSFDDARRLLERIPIVKFRNRLMRSTQEMKYRAVVGGFDRNADAFEAELDAAETAGPATLRYAPDFELPGYYSATQFHIKPGNYDGMPLAGLQYHYTMNMFTVGGLNSDQQNAHYVNSIPVPADGEVHRVLDLATSIGQSATALKARFPDAEVTGIDLALPMLRYATWRANRLGSPVNFVQMLAEDLQFPDDHFDLVFCYILFHEIPHDIASKVIDEAHRVLRPGGKFVVVDFASMPPSEVYTVSEYARAWDADYNGEPYSVGYVQSDFHERLAARFAEFEPAHPVAGGPVIKVRVGTK